ncbi:MAG: hypothetical protein J1F32_03605 [Erysipelotrichales bacterium]|nr:hypothetical protein [Erysipelotrichales bacterium]
MEDAIDFEKNSYGKVVYRRVQRLRKKGRKRGIDVPYLNYELTKPEKPRMAFLLIAIIAAILLTGVLVGTVFLYTEFIKETSIFKDIGEVFQVLFDPQTFLLTLGLSSIPAIMIIIAYLMLFGLILIPVLLIIYFYNAIYNIFYMSKCSKEEFAKGHVIFSRIRNLSIIIFIATVILILALLSNSVEFIKILVGAIYAGVVIALGGLLALMVFERSKCKKWFDNLEDDKKNNYLSHDQALYNVKKRIQSDRTAFSNLFNK